MGKVIKYDIYYDYLHACNNRQNYKIPYRNEATASYM